MTRRKCSTFDLKHLAASGVIAGVYDPRLRFLQTVLPLALFVMCTGRCPSTCRVYFERSVTTSAGDAKGWSDGWFLSRPPSSTNTTRFPYLIPVTMETQWKRDVSIKSYDFKDTRQKISVPLAMSANLRKKSFKLFKNPEKNNSWADLGPRSA